MSQELLAIIEQLEREKGIKKDVLIKAVESALLSAVRRVIDVKPNEELKVELDPFNGKIRAYKGEEEITSIDFGRIAASAARQVIIQKIREAEKDVVFNEFKSKEGEIVSGTVYRFDKGNIVVDLLGKAEGVLLKREQSPKEEFKQGQRIRAYIVEVKKDNKGAQIILSRRHVNLVKKLFELEVPEIYEGIVEMKSISRQAGERTKISVWSKNDKVDSVGACVGMRGSRVKNVVNELQGEKIDIVRFNEDIREYIKEALKPAEVSEIKLDKEKKRAEVIVAEDQLSLAIGKHGQNVQLASKLIAWELDIRAKVKEEAKEEKKEEAAVLPEKQEKKDKAQKQEESASMEQLPGVGEKTLALLKKGGFGTLEDIKNADVSALTEIKGIGEKKAQNLIAEAKKLLSK
jgi:N utilization substance protein A